MVTRIWEKRFFDNVRHATGTGPDTLEHRAAVDPGVDHPQPAPVGGSAVDGVAEGAGEHLLEHPRAAVGSGT